MYAMQYTIQLPADYDMTVIRDRVDRTGHMLDGYPGLLFKAYLIRERSQGAAGNEYAPFYVWREIDGMRSFCWGETGYTAIVNDFGRRPIQDWALIGVTEGPGERSQAKSLTKVTRSLPAGAAPSAAIPELTGEFLQTAGPSTIWRVAAVDVTEWSVILVELSTGNPNQGVTDPSGYEVLHLSLGGQDTGRRTQR